MTTTPKPVKLEVSHITEATHLANDLSPSHSWAPHTPSKYLQVTPTKWLKLQPALRPLNLQTDDSGATKRYQDSFELSWRDDGRYNHRLYISEQIVQRLKRNFTFPGDDGIFKTYLNKYLKHKYKDAQTGDYPFTVPSDFYLLCREVANVTHELFADAINCSGVCEYFCSASEEDLAWGSKGTWENVESTLSGGAGHPPNDTQFLRRLIATCEENILSTRPYCRIMLLQAKDDSGNDDVLYSEDFNGEVLAIMPVDLITDFRHQLDFFRDGCDEFPRNCEF